MTGAKECEESRKLTLASLHKQNSVDLFVFHEQESCLHFWCLQTKEHFHLVKQFKSTSIGKPNRAKQSQNRSKNKVKTNIILFSILNNNNRCDNNESSSSVCFRQVYNGLRFTFQFDHFVAWLHSSFLTFDNFALNLINLPAYFQLTFSHL